MEVTRKMHTGYWTHSNTVTPMEVTRNTETESWKLKAETETETESWDWDNGRIGIWKSILPHTLGFLLKASLFISTALVYNGWVQTAESRVCSV